MSEPPPPSDDDQRAMPPQNTGGANPIVLSVDDSETSRHVRSCVLRQAGFTVIEAASGKDALRLAAEEQPSLVVLDIRLPDIDGFEVCRRLKADPGTRAIPVLHVTAAGRAESDMPAALEHHSDAFLREPVEPETLVATAKALIRARQAELRQRQAEERAREEALRAERELIRANEQLQRVLETITEGYYAVDSQWRFTAVNPAAERFFGPPAPDLLGRNLWDVTGVRDGPSFDLFHKALAAGREVHLETESRFHPGVWIDAHAYPRHGGLEIYFHDITDRKRAELALRESEAGQRRQREFLETLLANAPYAIAVLEGPELRFTLVNPAYQAIAGPGVQLVGRTHGECFPESVASSVVDRLRNVLETGESWVIDSFKAPVPGKLDAVWAGQAVRLPFREGESRSILVLAWEITDRAAWEQALRDREAMLNAFFAASPGIANLLDDRFRYIKTDNLTPSYFGLTAESIVGQSVGDLAPEFMAAWGPIFERVIDETEPAINIEVHSPVPGKWGGIAYWRASYFRVPLPGGKRGLGVLGVDITDLKQAQEQIRRSEAKYRNLLEAAFEGIWVVDRQGRTEFVNSSMAEMLKRSPEDLLGRDAFEFVYDEDRDYLKNQFASRLSAGGAGRYEIRLRASDGSIVWAAVSGSNVRDEHGAVIGRMALFMDITERKRGEEALRESEERYRTLFTSMTEGFALGEAIFAEDGSPLDFRFLEVNDAFERQSGLGREILGCPMRKVLPHLEPVWAERYCRVASTGESVRFEEYNRDTGRHYSVFCYSPARGRFAILFRDITEIKRAEEELRDRERQFRELADFVPQLVWTTGPDGDRPYVNRRWFEQIGIAPDESLGDEWLEILHPEDRSRTLERWRKSLATGEPFEIECRFRVAGGEYRWFLARGVPSRDEHGRIVRWFGACTDIEESKRAEERLRQTQKLESVGLLAAGIAHDFNNLLTGIMGNASLALDEVGPGPAVRIREVLANAERAASLTRQLLAYSGKGQFVVRDIDVSQAVEGMADLVEFSIPKSVALALNVQRRLPQVRMDPSQLQQILMNLVINAGEAIGEGNPGRITVSTSLEDVGASFTDALGQEVAPGRYVCFEVVDTGDGICESAIPRIFDPFYTTKFTGRGMGLAATAGIVRSQKGAITVESAPGRGSTFRVLLPVAAVGAPNVEKQPPQNGRLTVLVVDDEASVRDFIGAVLDRQGYRVLKAADGRDALAIFDRENERIDALVLDVVMPVMSANDLLPTLKARQPEMQVLLTSGYSEAEARRLCGAYPGAAFIQKPYTAQQIVKAVEELLNAARR